MGKNIWKELQEMKEQEKKRNEENKNLEEDKEELIDKEKTTEVLKKKSEIIYKQDDNNEKNNELQENEDKEEVFPVEDNYSEENINSIEETGINPIKEENKEEFIKEVKDIVDTQNIKIKENTTSIIQIKVDKLIPYDANSEVFGEYTEEEKEALIKSIEVNGILYPIIVRPLKDDYFQILAGHRRVEAAKKIGMETVPCIIKEVDDDMAKLILVETNIVQKRNLSIMSLAKAYKMQADVYKKKNIDIRKKGENLKEEDKISNKLLSNGELAYRTISRYIRLNNLIPEFHELVNTKKVQINVASVIASLSVTVQKRIYNLITEDGMKFSEKQMTEIQRQEAEKGKAAITTDYIVEMFSKENEKKIKTSISFSEEEIIKYFGEEYIGNTEGLKKVILDTFSSESGGEG